MRSWGILSAIGLGFLVGLIFAGLSGLSNGLKASEVEKKLQTNKIEEFWAQTDLHETELRQLINNDSCKLSEKNFLACINSVISGLALSQQRLGLNGEILKFSSSRSMLDNFKERENLVPFSKIYQEGLHQTFNFNQLWSKILAQSNKDLPARYIMGIGINGYLSVMKDPHTYILPLQYFEQVSSSSERSPYFVGLSLDKLEGTILIKKVINNSDAAQAGLLKGDQILSINGQPTEKMNLSEIGQILRNKNTRIYTFHILREGQKYFKKVQRSYRVLSQIQSEIIEAHKNFGVINLSKFSKNSCEEVKQAIYNMAGKNISGLVLDLRDNPGGHMSEAACLAGLFIGENKKIYSVQYLDVTKASEVVLTSSEQIYSGPLVVLVNSVSASASELLAGALKEYRRAIIVGSQTFGKGTFQEIESWGESQNIGYFKTKGFYLLPSGASTQLEGIKPDIEVKSLASESSERANFFNPMKPFKNLKQPVEQVTPLPLQKCSSKTNLLTRLDVGLKEALATLSCGELMSSIALQFTGLEANQ